MPSALTGEPSEPISLKRRFISSPSRLKEISVVFFSPDKRVREKTGENSGCCKVGDPCFPPPPWLLLLRCAPGWGRDGACLVGLDGCNFDSTSLPVFKYLPLLLAAAVAGGDT